MSDYGDKHEYDKEQYDLRRCESCNEPEKLGAEPFARCSECDAVICEYCTFYYESLRLCPDCYDEALKGE